MGSCNVTLVGDQSMCPLCNAILPDTEAALDHYAQQQCEANPRTKEKLKQIIKQKL